MLNGKTVAVVVPAYNEETQIGMVIESMPDFVDRIVIINDRSTDRTREVVEGYFDTPWNAELPLPEIPKPKDEFNRYEEAEKLAREQRRQEEAFYPRFELSERVPERSRIVLLNHVVNSGKGAGIVTGYKYCRDRAIDCVGSMDGDGQMDPAELESLCLPVVNGEADYVKGNRLIHRAAWQTIPTVRCLGNATLSILTKIASGYWHVSDTQTGYAVIGRAALEAIPIHRIYRNYGYPNDVLVKLNIAHCTLKEVPIKPVYRIGEQSKMKLHKIIPRISLLLLRSFFVRLWSKYLLRDFHPLFLLYHLAFLLLLLSIPYAVKIIMAAVRSETAGVLPVLAFFFLFITGMQFILFGMWMDVQDNERLYR